MKLNLKALNYTTLSTILLIVALTIWSELVPSFKTNLASLTGHHWVTKSVVSLIFFIAVYFLLSKIIKDSKNPLPLIIKITITTILGGVIIFGFYIWHLSL